MSSVLFIRGSFSALNCAYLMSRYLVIFRAYVLWSLGIFSVLKMPVNFKPVSQDSGNFQQQIFAHASKYIYSFSVRLPQNQSLIYCALHYSDKGIMFFLLFLLLLTSKCSALQNVIHSKVAYCFVRHLFWLLPSICRFLTCL